MTSQINPNNINGNYPVAGQDNNSQGFRDNFTNTGTNFSYAAQEITDLQNKVLVTAQLTGVYQSATISGNVNLGFNSWPAAGQYATLRTQLTTTVANAVLTMPTSVGNSSTYTSLQYIIGRTANTQNVTMANAGTYVFEFSTVNGGSSIFIQDLTRGAAQTPTA